MKRAAHNPFFDKIPCDNTSEFDLDMDLIKKIFIKHHIQVDTTKLLSIGILCQKGKRIIEEWGSGYKRIKDACQKNGYPEPVWEELGTVMRVTFYPHPEVIPSGQHQIGTKLAPSRHQVMTKELDLETALIKLRAFCEEKRSIYEMMNFMGWTDRTKFRRKFIYPLIKEGLLTMTIPDKPNSSNQRYVIV